MDMASDLGEEMDTETEISRDFRDLLPRDGSVNAYGSHLAEMKPNRTKMMAPHVVKLVKFKWCVLRIFFKLYLKMFLYFVIQTRATDRLSLFACSPVHARLPAVGRKGHETTVARAGMLNSLFHHLCS